MYSYNPYYEQFLAHHGVKGMHWGIRRYQPYPKGSSASGKEVGEARRRSNSEIVARADKKEVLANYERLSTQELREANDRMQLLSTIKSSKSFSRGVKETVSLLNATSNITSSIINTANNAKKIAKTGLKVIGMVF